MDCTCQAPVVVGTNAPAAGGDERVGALSADSGDSPPQTAFRFAIILFAKRVMCIAFHSHARADGLERRSDSQ
jgi:hypothetical protein